MSNKSKQRPRCRTLRQTSCSDVKENENTFVIRGGFCQKENYVRNSSCRIGRNQPRERNKLREKDIRASAEAVHRRSGESRRPADHQTLTVDDNRAMKFEYLHFDHGVSPTFASARYDARSLSKKFIRFLPGTQAPITQLEDSFVPEKKNKSIDEQYYK